MSTLCSMRVSWLPLSATCCRTRARSEVSLMRPPRAATDIGTRVAKSTGPQAVEEAMSTSAQGVEPRPGDWAGNAVDLEVQYGLKVPNGLLGVGAVVAVDGQSPAVHVKKSLRVLDGT